MAKSKMIALLLIVAIMATMLASCGNNDQGINEPSESQPTTQEIEPTPTPNEDEPTKATQGQEAEQSSASPSQEPQEQEPTSTPSQEPITTQEPTQSQEPTTSQEPTPTTTPTTPPTSTPIHTHSFKGGNCSTPSTCECGEVGTYGDHNWTTKEVFHDSIGHYEVDEITQDVIVGYESYELLYTCRTCNRYKTTDNNEMHIHQVNTGHGGTIVEKQGVNPIYETQVISSTTYWVEDTPSWVEYITTCSICGTTK